MAEPISPLDEWLTELEQQNTAGPEQWDPGFDPNRQLVIRTIGPWRRRFPRRPNYRPWFFDRLHPLLIENWPISRETKILAGLCALSCDLTIHFQATFEYLNIHDLQVEAVNQHIKNHYAYLIDDLLLRELEALNNGDWIDQGLLAAEKRIEHKVNEILLLHHIQSRALCRLTAEFDELDQAALDKLPQGQHRKLLERHLRLEAQRQKTWLEQQELQHKQEAERKLQHLTFTETLAQRELQEQKAFLSQRHQLEKEVLARRIAHEQSLKLLEQEQKLAQEKLLKDKRREYLRQQQEQELADEIEAYQQKQKQWQAARAQIRQEQMLADKTFTEQEAEQKRRLREQQALQQQALEMKLQLEKLEHEAKLKEAELERRKQNAGKNQETADFLRQEIELLVLEQRRNEMFKKMREAEERLQLPEPSDQAE